MIIFVNGVSYKFGWYYRFKKDQSPLYNTPEWGLVDESVCSKNYNFISDKSTSWLTMAYIVKPVALCISNLREILRR